MDEIKEHEKDSEKARFKKTTELKAFRLTLNYFSGTIKA